MQRILVPTDFSNKAYHALRYATELMKNTECTFFLLHVYRRKGNAIHKIGDNGPDKSIDKLKEKSEERLEHTLHKIKSERGHAKHAYALILKPTDLIETVNNLVGELDIDLIVMGNKGKKGSIPLFLGNISAKIQQSVKKCPVLVVPKEADCKLPTHIAFATDYKNGFGPQTIGFLRSIALSAKADIDILHIDEEEWLTKQQKSNLNTLKAYLEPIIPVMRRLPDFISKTKIIQVFSKESGIDMLAMVNNEHGPVEKMLREPVIEKMVFHIDLPFLVLPDTD